MLAAEVHLGGQFIVEKQKLDIEKLLIHRAGTGREQLQTRTEFKTKTNLSKEQYIKMIHPRTYE
jgi:hypothetical protein